jgi:hypothetical protein
LTYLFLRTLLAIAIPFLETAQQLVAVPLNARYVRVSTC